VVVFSGTRIEGLSERAELLLLGPDFLRILSAERPDVASNFLRMESVVLAVRLAAADDTAKCALSMTGLRRPV
jgi:hypothetical protein